MDNQAQEGQVSFDSYDPVVGKWMTNLGSHYSHYSKGYEKLVCRAELTERPQAVL